MDVNTLILLLCHITCGRTYSIFLFDVVSSERLRTWSIKLSTKIVCPLPKDYRDLIHQFSGSGSGTRSRLASKAEESPNDDAILPDHQLVQGLENLLTANIPYYDIPIPLTTSVRPPPPATPAVTRRSTSTTQRQTTTRRSTTVAVTKAVAAKTTTGRSSGIDFNSIPSLNAKPTTTTARTPTNPKRVVNNNNKLPAGLLTISLLYSKAGTNNKTQWSKLMHFCLLPELLKSWNLQMASAWAKIRDNSWFRFTLNPEKNMGEIC